MSREVTAGIVVVLVIGFATIQAIGMRARRRRERKENLNAARKWGGEGR